jgi:hypothetical protein
MTSRSSKHRGKLVNSIHLMHFLFKAHYLLNLFFPDEHCMQRPWWKKTHNRQLIRIGLFVVEHPRYPFVSGLVWSGPNNCVDLLCPRIGLYLSYLSRNLSEVEMCLLKWVKCVCSHIFSCIILVQHVCVVNFISIALIVYYMFCKGAER